MTPLAELGTIQLEFRYLSEHVGDDKYAKISEDVIQTLHANSPENGLFPTLINPDTGRPNNRLVTFGALGDSFYEYLLKVCAVYPVMSATTRSV
jgi:mannosyl-oligosaccharide alpha-1,2-mannosidase